MATLARIGNSQGIRIPKAIIEQADLAGAEIVFEVTPEGLLLKPVRHNPREGWSEQIAQAIKAGGQEPQNELLDLDLDAQDWEW